MIKMKSFGIAFGALLSLFTSSVLAQDSQNPSASTSASASTFYLTETETQFSLNIPNDTSNSDVFIYFTSPAYSWVGVGFGNEMKNSLMFVMYPSQNGDNVTISPRIATGHTEPTFAPQVDLEILPGTTVNDSMFVVKAVCHFCRAWAGGSLDISDKQHPMIYAFGSGHRIQSNSPEAGLKRHSRFGKFTMDMVAATGKGGVPAPENQVRGVKIQGMKRDHDRANLAHAVLGCLAIFVLWPLNVILAGFIKRIGVHVGMSIFIVVFLISAFALGIAASGEYNRSKDFRSAHQILAFISILPILLLSILPIRPIANLAINIIPRLHTPLTTLTLFFLILTGGLGLNLGAQTRPIILAYSAVSVLVFIICLLLTTCVKRRGSSYARNNPNSRNPRQRGYIEEDQEDLVLKYWKGGKETRGGTESRSTSASSLNRPSESQAYGAGPGHERSASAGSSRGIYGGGAMPGPQYLLNMHPGVPVYPGGHPNEPQPQTQAWR